MVVPPGLRRKLLLTLLLRLMSRPDSPVREEMRFSDLNLLYSSSSLRIGYNFSSFCLKTVVSNLFAAANTKVYSTLQLS